MIYLNKDTTNQVILTLTDNSGLLNPYYIFHFQNDLNRNEKIFTATDLSGFKCRYNRFQIVETGSTYENLYEGIVNLNPPGFWTYTVYETPYSGTTELSATTGVVLETGKVYVNGVDNNINNIYR